MQDHAGVLEEEHAAGQVPLPTLPQYKQVGKCRGSTSSCGVSMWPVIVWVKAAGSLFHVGASLTPASLSPHILSLSPANLDPAIRLNTPMSEVCGRRCVKQYLGMVVLFVGSAGCAGHAAAGTARHPQRLHTSTQLPAASRGACATPPAAPNANGQCTTAVRCLCCSSRVRSSPGFPWVYQCRGCYCRV
jgi:hypothetical protein